MVCKCICTFVVQSLFLFSLFALALLLIPNLPPYASFQESYRVPTPKPLEGKLAVNERLENVELWHNGEILHPEAFAAYNSEIYASLFSGEIVKLTGQHITPIVKTGKPCRGRFEERICGRPLGLQFNKNGALYVADAYYGILKVDVKTGRKEVVVSPDTKINGKEPKIFNSLSLASNGDIYWTDSSTDFYLDDGMFTTLADSSGRLIHYDAKTKQNKVLIDKLRFANGVMLSEDETEVLVVDMYHMRILRYYLKGSKAGTHDVFIDGLPGYPDNLNRDGKGGYIIPLLVPADRDHPQMLTVFNEFPLFRKFLARLLGVTQMIFEMIDRAYPNDYSLRAIHFIGHFSSAGILMSKHRVTIIHVSKSGEILDSIHTTTKPFSVSEAFIHKDTLYLGSPFDLHIGRIKLSEVGWAHLAQVQSRKSAEQAKPTPAPVKQETTTSKPATKQTVPPTQKQTPPPTKPTTNPPQKETTTVPPKQATTTSLPPTQKQTPPPTPKQAPPKPQTTTTPPPPVQKQAAPPAQQQTPPVKQVPPQQKQATPQTQPKQATPQTQPKQATPQTQQTQATPQTQQKPATPQQKQATPQTQQKQATPQTQQKQVTPQTQQPTTPPVQKQMPPPAKQQTPPPVQKQSPPPKQTPPPQQQHSTTSPPVQKQSPPPKQTPPQQQQPSTTPPPPKQTPPPQQQQRTTPPPVQKQPPPPQQQQRTPTPQAKQSSPPPSTQNPPVKESPQPKPATKPTTTKEQAKTVPVRETMKTR